ncbi:MAG: ribosome recycling factor [Desulfonauticus sp.]|jgi:ribosome recycling factor|nr:ribosome recycling factor [Desulfonauticus sp.]
MEKVFKDGKAKMQKAIKALEQELAKLRTGRASTGLVEDLKVDYYGTPTPLNQLASISIPDSRTIAIQPWDRSAFSEIEKAILKSDLGLTPVNDGKIIRINLPPLTEERRKDLVKLAKKYGEESKIAIRNIRRELNETLKKMKNNKEITEDDLHKGQEEVQKLTDQYIEKIDKIVSAKETEIMEI